MLTTLDTTLLIPRQQPGGNGSNPVQTSENTVFTIPELMDILENRPEIREAFRQSLIDYKKKEEEENRDAQQHQQA